MKHTIELELVKMARKSGGDRYEGEFQGNDYVQYIPQNISRPNNRPEPLPKAKITLVMDE